MENNAEKNVDFVDEHGEKATMHIASSNGYKVNMFNNGKYKLANSSKKNNDLLGINKKTNLFTRDIGFKTRGNSFLTRDIGIKSSGFAQVASLSFIIALAGFFILFIMFKY